MLYFGTPVVLLSTENDDATNEPAKFDAAGLRPQPSHHVRPPRVADCPLRMEARAVRIRTDASGGFGIVVPGTQHVDPGACRSFRPETAAPCDAAPASPARHAGIKPVDLGTPLSTTDNQEGRWQRRRRTPRPSTLAGRWLAPT
ncbi:hypothetical protein WEI85_43325 [Actinomycetes bacterium KLBMP 9797]